MPIETPLEIVEMEPWMLRGMAELRMLEYGGELDAIEARLRHLFDSDFSHRSGTIALVGLSGQDVVGMQTYSPWPYQYDGRRYVSLQSGATLVHPAFRGKRLFQRMLMQGTALARTRGVDFFMGFPVPMSYPGFLKDGWRDMGKLRWWTRPLHPLALLRQRRQGGATATATTLGEPLQPDRLGTFPAAAGRFTLADAPEFLRWRYADESRRPRYFEFRTVTRCVGFTIRTSTSHGYSEVLVGKIRSDDRSVPFTVRALGALCRVCSDKGITAVSAALVNPSLATRAALLLSGFIPANLGTPLIVKALRAAPEVVDKHLWHDVSLEDVDTW